MPVIARFYGIIVKMYLLGGEHNPPHVHILYGEKTVSLISIRSRSKNATSPQRPARSSSNGLPRTSRSFSPCGKRSRSACSRLWNEAGSFP